MKSVSSHGLAFLLGVALGTILVQPGKHGNEEPVRSMGATTKTADEGGKTPARERAASGVKRGDAFREAWKLLAARDEPMTTRLANQRKLLQAWAEVDLAGAMDAAMAEAWDEEDGGSGNPPLLDAFQKSFMQNPLAAWKLIQSGRYGVGAQLLRKEWVNSVCIKDGLLVISMLDELPASLRREAIGSAAVSAGRSPGKLDEILAKMATFPPGADTDQWIAWASQSIPDGGNAVELRGKWSGAAPGPARTVALQAWGASLRQADAGTLAAEWASLQDAEKGEAAKAILAQLYPDSRGLLPALEVAMAAGEWDYLAKHGPELLAEHEIGDRKLAEWAMTLPGRDEAEPLFRSAMDRYMEDDFSGAREWITSMPPDDWHTQQALAEYARTALQEHDDEAEANWALEQISDPALKGKTLKENALKRTDILWTSPDE